MPDFRSGFVAILGRPNVGKSTLINALLGQKIAAVSARPQTTRRRQLAILTGVDYQLVLVDTPGMHEPRHMLGAFMNAEAETALTGADAVLFLVDLTTPPTPDDARIADLINALRTRPPLVLAGNKLDLLGAAQATERMAEYGQLLQSSSEVILLSATRGDGLQGLVELLCRLCPLGSPQFGDDQVTDLYEREIAADLIREAALLCLRDEVPHGLAVRIDEFTERESGLDYIHATLLVERESQKAIAIGHGGKMLKQIGSGARREIENMTGRRAFLELRVKVEKGWRNRQSVLELLGYQANR